MQVQILSSVWHFKDFKTHNPLPISYEQNPGALIYGSQVPHTNSNTMRNPKDLKVNIYPTEADAKLAGIKAQVPTRSNTSTMKHNGKPLRKSKGSSLSRTLSVRDGRVSPLQEPPSPCGSKRDSLIWALDEDAPRPKRARSNLAQLPAHEMRNSAELFNFQVAQGIPDDIGFKPASTAPHPPQLARGPSKRAQHPRAVQHDRRYQELQQTDIWTTIPLDDRRSRATIPQRPIRAVPARPKDRGVYAMQPNAEAGRAQTHHSSRHEIPQRKKLMGRHRQCTRRKILFGLFAAILGIGLTLILVLTKKH